MKQLNLFKPNDDNEKIQKKKHSYDTSLGPETKGMDYREYLKSYEWQNKRRYALYMAGYRCEHCKEKKKKLSVHHKHYETLFHERLQDVVVLCSDCHANADTLREYNSSHETYAYKIYGSGWEYFDDDELHDEFDEWWKNKNEY